MSIGLSKQDREVLNRIFGGGGRDLSKMESRRKAEEILARARPKTRPGSGYDLGALSGTGVLSAVCAFIACRELQNQHCDEKTACGACCISVKDFGKALNKVETALAPTKRAQQKTTAPPLSYETLIQEFSLSDPAWLAKQMHLVKKFYDNLDDELKPTVKESVIMCSVFLWTCNTLNISADRLGPETLSSLWKVPKKDIRDVMEIFHAQCDHEHLRLLDAKESLEDEKRLQKLERSSPTRPASPAKPSSPRKAPTKKFSPTKEDLHRRTLPSKRLVEDEDPTAAMDVDTPQTSAKVRKLDLTTVANRAPGTSRKPQIPFPSPMKKPSVSLPDLSTLELNSPKKPEDTPTTLRRSTRLQPSQTPVHEVRTPMQTPSRPRTRLISPSKPKPTVMAMDVDEEQPSSSEEDVEKEIKLRPQLSAMRRRSRFVYAEHHQWIARDPRIERMKKAGEMAFKAMSEKYGSPAY